MPLKIHKKDISRQLVFGLTAKEFQCQCDYSSCTNFIATTELLYAYKAFRYLVDKPLSIASGFRCRAHNHDEHGSMLSRHTSGQAIDIYVYDLLPHLSQEQIVDLAKKAGFTFIKPYWHRGFIHLDVRPLNEGVF